MTGAPKQGRYSARCASSLKEHREQNADDLPEALRAMVATQGIFAIAAGHCRASINAPAMHPTI